MPRDTPTAPTAIPGRLLAALALSLIPALGVAANAAQAQAAAQQEIRLTIPYALLVHADAYQTTTLELEDAVHLAIEARAPLRLFLHTNDNWRLTIRTAGGHIRTLRGAHGQHTLTSADLDHLPLTDGEVITISVEREPRNDP